MTPDLDRKRLKLQGPFPDACFDQSKALFLQFTPVTEMQWETKIAKFACKSCDLLYRMH